MSKSPDRKNLELSVRNLGPIARSDLDLRPMTVFVGPSNTGKSYLAMLVYALHRFFNGRVLDDLLLRTEYGRNRTIFNFGSGFRDERKLSHEELETLSDWLSRHLSGMGAADFSEPVPTVLPESIAKLVRPLFEYIGTLNNFLDTEIRRCYSVDDSLSLVRNQVRSGTKIAVKRPVSDISEAPTAFEYGFSIRASDRELVPHIPASEPLRFHANRQWYEQAMEMLGWVLSPYRDDDDRSYIVRGLIRRLAEEIGTDIISPLSHPAYYLPADRTGVMRTQRVLVGSIIGQASRPGFLHDSPLPQLSGVLADFLGQLIGLDDKPEGSLDRRLAHDIERDILQGKVRMERSIVGYPEFFYRPTGWTHDLRLTNSSSMVSELTPVVLYLRHVVRPGETLIIEEPESSLHPAMQVEFIRHLAAAVRAGVRILITTHSEWVLDELTNLALLNELPESRRKGIGGADFALDPDDVGVWLFEPKKSPKGTIVKEIPFDVEFGGFRSGFDDVAVGTYNDYARISNRIEEKRFE